MTTNTTDIPTAGPLQMTAERIKAVDPLSGPNLMRYAAAHFNDNGDGTMTLKRPVQQKNNVTTKSS